MSTVLAWIIVLALGLPAVLWVGGMFLALGAAVLAAIGRAVEGFGRR